MDTVNKLYIIMQSVHITGMPTVWGQGAVISPTWIAVGREEYNILWDSSKDLTVWSRVFEKLIVTQLLKKFSVYGT